MIFSRRILAGGIKITAILNDLFIMIFGVVEGQSSITEKHLDRLFKKKNDSRWIIFLEVFKKNLISKKMSESLYRVRGLTRRGA